MSEGGDFELFNAPAAQEKDEKADEKVQEEMRRMAAAIAQLRKEESQFKANDQSLAAVIVQFLSQPGNTDLFLLISRAVGQDVPSELILAIISLIDERSTEEVYRLLRGGKEQATTALAVRASASFQALPAEHKQAIDQWIKNIHEVSLRRPRRVLESLVVRREDTREISPTVLQLSAFVLRKYLNLFGITSDFDQLYRFAQAVFVEILKNLEQFVQEQRQLKSA